MKRLVIDRSRWLRGEGGDESYLRRPKDGRQCCLGFLAREIGCTEEEITGEGDFVSLTCFTASGGEMVHVHRPEVVEWPGWLKSYEGQAIRINDDVFITDAEREEELTELFKRGDYELVFIDGPEVAS